VANQTVMPKIRAWMETAPGPATIPEIARGARVSQPTVRRFIHGLGPAEVTIVARPGWPRYQLTSPRSFAGMLAAAAYDEQLTEAYTGISRIAKAAGITPATYAARSMAEVCDMIARWCLIRRGLRLPELGFMPERDEHG
jgi:hypothetical protein